MKYVSYNFVTKIAASGSTGAELQQVQARAGYSSALAGVSSSAVSLGKRIALGPGLGVDVPGVDSSACNTSLLPSLSSPATAGAIEQCR